MEFDIHKYDRRTFSDDDLTHKRIKALLLWFEYEVYKKDIPLSSQIPMMTQWIKKLEAQEYYEVLPFFTKMRDDMIIESKTVVVNKVKKDVKVAEEVVVEPLLIRLKTKIINWFRLLFNLK